MSITILTNDSRWKGQVRRIRAAAQAALAHQSILNADATIVLSNDAEVQQYNNQYRGFDKPTNVLSFEDGSMLGNRRQLGDILLAIETIRREANDQGKSFEDHMTHLVVHGVLHLLGHDHMKKAEAKRMESLEIAILAAMDIANPYE